MRRRRFDVGASSLNMPSLSTFSGGDDRRRVHAGERRARHERHATRRRDRQRVAGPAQHRYKLQGATPPAREAQAQDR